jgi:predicted HicB family RNase H-like nuclease
MTPRQYSREHTPSKRQKRRYLMVDKIPAELDIAVRAKAKREGVSLRALILSWLKEWVSK